MRDLRATSFRDLAELAVGYALILLVLWTSVPLQGRIYWVAVGACLLITLASRPTRDQLGLGRRGLIASLWIVAAALAFAGMSILVAWKLGTLHPLYGRNSPLNHVIGYMVWAFFQQFLAQDYFLQRLLNLLPSRGAAVACAALLFALAHLPNPVLTPVTLVWGLAAGALFLRYRNLYALGLAQAILGLCIAVSVPDELHRHMRVGLAYLQYHP